MENSKLEVYKLTLVNINVLSESGRQSFSFVIPIEGSVLSRCLGCIKNSLQDFLL